MKIFSNYNFRQSDYKMFWLTIVFYIVMIGLIYLLMHLFPMGPCADIPSMLVMLLFICTLITSAIFLIKTLIQTIKKDKRFIISFLVHLIFWIGYIMLIILTE
jgi:hypothetical protein